MRKALGGLAAEELAIGGGPLFFAVLAGWKAVRTDDPFTRWICVTVAALMLVLCAIYLVWATRRARPTRNATVERSADTGAGSTPRPLSRDGVAN